MGSGKNEQVGVLLMTFPPVEVWSWAEAFQQGPWGGSVRQPDVFELPLWQSQDRGDTVLAFERAGRLSEFFRHSSI